MSEKAAIWDLAGAVRGAERVEWAALGEGDPKYYIGVEQWDDAYWARSCASFQTIIPGQTYIDVLAARDKENTNKVSQWRIVCTMPGGGMREFDFDAYVSGILIISFVAGRGLCIKFELDIDSDSVVPSNAPKPGSGNDGSMPQKALSAADRAHTVLDIIEKAKNISTWVAGHWHEMGDALGQILDSIQMSAKGRARRPRQASAAEDNLLQEKRACTA